jgi:hypothetical protein
MIILEAVNFCYQSGGFSGLTFDVQSLRLFAERRDYDIYDLQIWVRSVISEFNSQMSNE